eukprot:TRINITY_DN20896_c0_g1::TRINITY_DN20896_c0_g1_i1::g.12433::m.12433 TRINITY_DN20896_c0_g1::TRINITY_DN20896_c0_g1_i1::g.12433  ORF type:complete len:171 (+),score=6.01,sp/Q5ZLX5/ZRAB2_CHICK/56.25/8e-16,zf-RanBP/PF00641.13/7.6e-06,zf-RanBP/PF00641.13/5e+02,Desulfoferrod_N/PF06397.7/0.43,Desulfoferrod_N/PF06397.7/2e+02 TRINITY_DN20896_c0_g1_i1:34-546(+)
MGRSSPPRSPRRDSHGSHSPERSRRDRSPKRNDDRDRRDRDRDRDNTRDYRDRDRDRKDNHRDHREDRPAASELGRESERFGGLFKPNDWKCTMCGNINWARRSTCNECNAPKPGRKTEERTGAGGGFREITDDDVQDLAERKYQKEQEIEERKKEKRRCEVCKRFACIC